MGDEVLDAPAGTFVFAPRGLPHNFTVDIEPTRVLALVSPAGFEHFTVEVGEPFSSSCNASALIIVASIPI